MSQPCNKLNVTLSSRVAVGIAVFGCVQGGFVPTQVTAASASEWRPAQAFPVSYAPAKHPVALLSSGPDVSADSGGLYVPELDESVMTYSDLLWTKDDYRAWVSGTAYRMGAQDDKTDGVFPVSFLTETVGPSRGAFAQWNLGERNWRYAVDPGFDVTLGNTEIGTSVLSNRTQLGGIQIRHSMPSQDNHDAADWKISMAVGALDYSSADRGDLNYGPTAANTVVHYGLGDHAALESAVQVAPDLVTTTLGGRFDTGRWGQLLGGVAHGGLADQRGWRYQAGYNVHVMDDLHVSVLNEWDAPGFADLAHYRGGVASGVRSNLSATVPTRHWGDISGTYESFRPDDGLAIQRFGFSQQFWYSPNLRIGFSAQREVVSGDYDIGIRFSVPIN